MGYVYCVHCLIPAACYAVAATGLTAGLRIMVTIGHKCADSRPPPPRMGAHLRGGLEGCPQAAPATGKRSRRRERNIHALFYTAC